MNSWWMSEYPSYPLPHTITSTQNTSSLNLGGRAFGAPWSVTPPSQMPWSSQPVQRFTGSSEDMICDRMDDDMFPSGKPTKRRIQNYSLGPKQKQLITEEIVAETLGSLSLEDQAEVYLPGSSIDVSPKLVLSEELKRFQEHEEEIVPKSILRSQEKLNNALVLWKPPGGDVINLIRASNLQIRNDEELSDITGCSDNNNSMLPDVNQSRPEHGRHWEEEDEMAD